MLILIVRIVVLNWGIGKIHVIGLGYRMVAQYTLMKGRKFNCLKSIKIKAKVTINFLWEKMDIFIQQMIIPLQ